jgi:hypothetical protein
VSSPTAARRFCTAGQLWRSSRMVTVSIPGVKHGSPRGQGLHGTGKREGAALRGQSADC